MCPSVVSPLGSEHLDEVHDLFRNEWWTRTRTRSDVERIVAGSTTTVGLVDGSQLLAFARVLSDGCYLAIVLDVIVASDHRGSGLGDQLMDALLHLPEVASVNSVELVCQPEATAFYGRHGFGTDVGTSTLMRRTSDAALRD